MDKVLLISENKIKDDSLITLNVDNKILQQTILQSQFINLRPILGDKLYKEVLDDVKNKVADDGYEMQYKELLEDYIQPFVIADVQRSIIINLTYRISNKGFVKYSDTNADTVGANDLEYGKNYFDNRVGAYKASLIKYLQDQDLCTCETDTHIEGYASGWYLEGLGGCY